MFQSSISPLMECGCTNLLLRQGDSQNQWTEKEKNRVPRRQRRFHLFLDACSIMKINHEDANRNIGCNSLYVLCLI